MRLTTRAHATAFLGGVVRRDGVTIAISTDGRAPALAGLLREALDAWLPSELDAWMKASDEARRSWREQGADGTPTPSTAGDLEPAVRVNRKSQIPKPKSKGTKAGAGLVWDSMGLMAKP